jgi:cytochrome P450
MVGDTVTREVPAGGIAPGPTGRRAAIAIVRERRRDPLGMFTRLRDEHGPVVCFRMGPLEMLLVTEPDLVQEVFTTHADRVRKGRILEGARVVLGDGLLTAEGDVHRRHRRLIQPAFRHERLEGYARVMTRRAAAVADRWEDGSTIDVLSEMGGLTMGVVGETLFGTEIEGERERVEAALVDVFRAFDLLVLPFAGLRMRVPTRTVRRFRAARRELDRVVGRIVAERRAAGGDRGDLLSELLAATDEEGRPALDDDEVRHEVMTLFTAGLETTANALAFTWHLLARHPEVERRMRAEAAALPGDPTAGDLPALGVTAAVLSESLRLYPPAWMLARRALAPLRLGPFAVPEGGLVMMPPYLLHRDPRFWPDAERFDPARWMPSGASPPHRYSYIPFGAGGRKCIGAGFATMEGVLLLATIARRARLLATSDEDLALLPQITLRPAGPLRMRIAR